MGPDVRTARAASERGACDPVGMPPPSPGSTVGRSNSQAYVPALDGLRGLAVVAVLLFHGGFSWTQGGFLGVSTSSPSPGSSSPA